MLTNSPLDHRGTTVSFLYSMDAGIKGNRQRIHFRSFFFPMHANFSNAGPTIFTANQFTIYQFSKKKFIKVFIEKILAQMIHVNMFCIITI